MSVETLLFDRRGGGWSVLAALADADGSARHPFIRAMCAPGAATRDLAGCAVGASIALVLDWHAVRALMSVAADRAGFAPLPSNLPIDAETQTIAVTLAAAAPVERAMSFGAQQLLAQHRALWDLAEA